jgi:metal-responsive CopG/Arc/MetJ family transcriptional regulator
MEFVMNTLNLEKFEKTIRTTVTLPSGLIDRSQHFVEKGVVPSRNALIIAAVERFLIELERVEIDRQFAAMQEDEDYQALNEEIANAFAESDWEALTLIEEVDI